MSYGNNPDNPYQSPSGYGQQPGPIIPRDPGAKLLAPAIALIVVGGLGVVFDLINVAMALLGAPPQIDPNAPEFVQQMQAGGHGPVAAMTQLVFVVVSAIVVFGGVQMCRRQTWGLALAASILAMVNCGNLCCVLGLPIGIWALVILCLEDVKAAFV